MINRNSLAWDKREVAFVRVISAPVTLPHSGLTGYVVRPMDNTGRQYIQTAENLEPQDAVVRQLNVRPRPRLATVDGMPAC